MNSASALYAIVLATNVSGAAVDSDEQRFHQQGTARVVSQSDNRRYVLSAHVRFTPASPVSVDGRYALHALGAECGLTSDDLFHDGFENLP